MPRSGRAQFLYPVAFLFLSYGCLCAAAAATSPAEQKISAALQSAKNSPKSPQPYSSLAAAYCERARETGDISFFTSAETALKRVTEIAPDDYTAQKLHVTVLLGRHQWAEALASATALNGRVPDDIPVWGLVFEANFNLGNYAAAEKAAQWMFDLRPGNPAGFQPSAKLREVSGDLEGAIDFVNEAYHRTPESESAERAALLTESARLRILNGSPTQAAELLSAAYRLYPDYHQALKVSASLDRAQAAFLLERRYRQVKTAEALYDWAEALEQAGKKQEASAAFQNFEQIAQGESRKPYNANRELVFYYTDHHPDPVKALAIATYERSIRHDNATRDAYAWALFRSGRIQAAQSLFEELLKTGTRDPAILSHAATIRTPHVH